jgi:hypothetical protein
MWQVEIVPVVLYGYEIWCLPLWEEKRLMVFENRVLRNIFGHKKEEVTDSWRKLNNGELHNFTLHLTIYARTGLSSRM